MYSVPEVISFIQRQGELAPGDEVDVLRVFPLGKVLGRQLGNQIEFWKAELVGPGPLALDRYRLIEKCPEIFIIPISK